MTFKRADVAPGHASKANPDTYFSHMTLCHAHRLFCFRTFDSFSFTFALDNLVAAMPLFDTLHDATQEADDSNDYSGVRLSPGMTLFYFSMGNIIIHSRYFLRRHYTMLICRS